MASDSIIFGERIMTETEGKGIIIWHLNRLYQMKQ